MSYLHAVLIVSGALLTSACVTTNPPPVASAPAAAPAPRLDPAQQQLAEGIKRYEEGDYKASITALNGALAMGLESTEEQARAHKHLAFIHCVSKREKRCHEEFKKALASSPGFDLEPAEAGHPLWGSVFRKEKARFAKSAK